MTRQKCEQKLLKKLREMVDILHEYSPGSKYLSASYCEGHYSVSNVPQDKEENEISAFWRESYGQEACSSVGSEKGITYFDIDTGEVLR